MSSPLSSRSQVERTPWAVWQSPKLPGYRSTAAFNLIPLEPLASVLLFFPCRKWLGGKGTLGPIVTYMVVLILEELH